MTTKSNIYHYFSYVIYALVFFCTIGLYSVSIVRASGSTDYLIPMVTRYGIIIAAILILIFGYRALIKYLPDKFRISSIPDVSKMIETGLLVLIMVVMTLVRMISVVSMFSTEVSSEYYDFARGLENSLSNTTMLAYMYGNICKLLLNIHPSIYPIIIFNAVLHILIVGFTYYTLKIALRIRYSIIAVLLLAFMPQFSASIVNIKPDTFYMFLIALYLFFLVKICKMNKMKKIEENYCLIFFILLGFGGGFIASLDMLGLVLYLITIPSFCLITNDDPWLKIQKNWFQCLIYSGAFFAGLFLSLYLINVNGLLNFENVMNYVFSFIPSGLNVDILVPMAGRQEGIAILIFAGISIFAFLRNEYDKGLYYVLIIDIAAVLTFVNFNNNDYEFIVNYAWIMLAVIGLFSIPSFVLTKEENEQARIKKKEKENKKLIKDQERFINKGEGKVISLNSTDESPIENVESKPVEDTKTIETKDTKQNKKEDKKLQKEKKLKKNKKLDQFVLNDSNETLEKKDNEVNVSVVDKLDKEVVETKEENLAPVTLTPIKVEPVYAEPVDPSKILPSRKEYKTAHVYKSDEDKARHDENVNKPITLQDAELKGKPAMIKNVLPTPKPHVSKEMNFDYELKEDELDYDITDIKGREYYDI